MYRELKGRAGEWFLLSIQRPDSRDKDDGDDVDEDGKDGTDFEEIDELVAAGTVNHEAGGFERSEIGTAGRDRDHHGESTRI